MNYGAQQLEASGLVELGQTWIWEGLLWSIVSLGLQHLSKPSKLWGLVLLLLLFAP